MRPLKELQAALAAYDPDADLDLIGHAYSYGKNAHDGQYRASGKPYFGHPIDVAFVCINLKLDQASIATALLHDVVEDTPVTVQQIRDRFGDDVALLVDGVTKLSELEVKSKRTKQAENFQKLMVGASDDIRILLVKLADRLDNMRTLGPLRPDKRVRIAKETMEIYAPLAERMGIIEIKDELQDLAFSHINPEGREAVRTRLEAVTSEGMKLVESIIFELEGVLRLEGLEPQITGRVKSLYSIFEKMERKEIEFDQLSDIMGFRLILPTVGDCYAALGYLHGAYQMVPGRFKDYISVPKRNGYKSLHTGIMGPKNKKIEIQIRTPEMQAEAQFGVAAHFLYKRSDIGGKPSRPKDEAGEPLRFQSKKGDKSEFGWLQNLTEILDNASDPDEFLEHSKIDLFSDQVFCFTPKGELVALPTGASIVDFAYQVHSKVGDTCVGGIVNGRNRPLSHRLKNGDQVEILRSKNATPSPDWESFVVTGKAKAAIRRFRRQAERDQYIELGMQLLSKFFEANDQEFTRKGLEAALSKLKLDEADEALARVGSGILGAREVLYAVYPAAKDAHEKAIKEKANVIPAPRQTKKSGKTSAVSIGGLIQGMAYRLAGCCHPLPGDNIVGIVHTGSGITVHTADCETLVNFEAEPERWLAVAWQNDDEGTAVGRLEVLLHNLPGALGELSIVVGKSGGNISNIRVISRDTDFFNMLIDVEVADLRNLNNIVAALRASKVVAEVKRARGS